MVQVPDDLRCLFSARVEERDGGYVVEVPREEVERGNVEAGGVYRVAALGLATDGPAESGDSAAAETEEHPTPPVETGETRQVEIEATGDQGDGIAKVERGYVVIVQDGEPGEAVEVEVTTVRENFAIARKVE